MLARISSMLARRGFNIHSLAVGPTAETAMSRMTIVVDAPEMEQIVKQLHKLVNVVRVSEIPEDDRRARDHAGPGERDPSGRQRGARGGRGLRGRGGRRRVGIDHLPGGGHAGARSTTSSSWSSPTGWSTWSSRAGSRWPGSQVKGHQVERAGATPVAQRLTSEAEQMRHHLVRRRCRPVADPAPPGGGDRVRQPGSCPRAQPHGVRHRGRRRAASRQPSGSRWRLRPGSRWWSPPRPPTGPTW